MSAETAETVENEVSVESNVVHTEHWTIPLDKITKVENCRNEPENLFKQGYKLVDASDVEHSLIHMALSEDMDVVRLLVELFEEYESDNLEDDDKRVAPTSSSIIAFASRLKRYEQFHPIIVRQDDESPDAFTLLAGNRRTAAITYLHAKTRVEVADGVEGSKIYPAEVIATNRQVSDDEGFLISVEENISTKTLTPLQEARIYKGFRSRINPATGKNWTLTDIAQYLYPGQNKQGTIRNREALLRPRREAQFDEKGNLLRPAVGLTEDDLEDLEAGRMTLTAATRRALGEQHYSDSNAPKGSRAKALPLQKMQSIFDTSDEENEEFRKGIAVCMNIDYKQACEESAKRIEMAEAKTVRKK